MMTRSCAAHAIFTLRIPVCGKLTKYISPISWTQSEKGKKTQPFKRLHLILACFLTLLDDVSVSLDDNNNDDKRFCIQCKIYIYKTLLTRVLLATKCVYYPLTSVPTFHSK